MSEPRIMLLAGEASGDALGAELVEAMRAEQPKLEAFGAGGPKLQLSGVEVAIDLTEHAVVGVWEAIRHYPKFKRFFNRLLELALDRKPDTIICIDNPGFNLRFVKAIRERTHGSRWKPRIVYYISPQLWAWHESRVHQIARDVDLLLSIFPFEKDWYAKRKPGFPVEFVGHPICDRFPGLEFRDPTELNKTPKLLLLPGSRAKEVSRHFPAMAAAVKELDVEPTMVLPDESLIAQAKLQVPEAADWDIRLGGLDKALAETDVAIASSGTVTLECAWFRVPTVVLYKTSWITYLLGRLFVKVDHIAMPNVLAGSELFPEFIQREASAENLSRAANRWIADADRRVWLREHLDKVATSLGGAGAPSRAAKAVWRLMAEPVRV